MKSRGAEAPPGPACRAARRCRQGRESRLNMSAANVPCGAAAVHSLLPGSRSCLPVSQEKGALRTEV